MEIIKPRILFILHLPPPIHGAAMVGKYIHDSKLVNEAFDCRFENMALAQKLEDIGHSGVKKLFNFISQLHEFGKAIKEFSPELVYITPNACGKAFYKDYFIVQYVKRCLKKYSPKSQIVIHYHNKGVSTRQDNFFDNWLYKSFFKRLRVILLADILYDDIKKYVSKNNVYVCPNGIPESLQLKQKTQLRNEVPNILFLSNLIISKGVFVLLDALKILKDNQYKFVCKIVGGETDEISKTKLITEICNRNLDGSVLYAGRKTGAEKNEFFANADIFAFPTFYANECFPLVCLEAMEYQLPIVSTNEGGIPDIVVNGHNGLICERQKPQSLALSLIKLLDDSNLRLKMGECGYQRFKSEFTLEVFEKRFVDIINQILANKNNV